MAFTKMRGGNQKSFNNWLRFRVVAQGFTVAAIVGGTYFYGHSKQQKEDRAAEEAARLAAEREQEKLEFEQRLKAAEEAHAMETAVQVGKSVVAGLGESSVINATPTTTPLSSESSSSSSSSGWFGWFGGRSAKKD